MTDTPDNNAKILWQEVKDGESIPEPALLIEAYNDVINITQEKRHVCLNYDTLDELFNVLRDFRKRAKNGTLK